MTLSKLLGSRSRTLEARAPARRDSEKIDDENFMKYVNICSVGTKSGAAGRKKGGFKKAKVTLHQPCVEL